MRLLTFIVVVSGRAEGGQRQARAQAPEQQPGHRCGGPRGRKGGRGGLRGAARRPRGPSPSRRQPAATAARVTHRKTAHAAATE